MSHYFVTVYARTADDLRGLQRHALDLFAPTAKSAEAATEFGFSIEGLLTLAEVESLVKAGYRVMVEDPMEARTQAARTTVEFTQWLQSMQPAIACDSSITK